MHKLLRERSQPGSLHATAFNCSRSLRPQGCTHRIWSQQICSNRKLKGARCRSADESAAIDRRPTGDPDSSQPRQSEDLDKAMKAVSEALKKAEASLETVQSLPSSRMPREVHNILAPALYTASLSACLLHPLGVLHCQATDEGRSVQAPMVLTFVRLALAVVAAVAVVVGSHSFGWPFRIAAGVLAGAGLGAYGCRKGSLSHSGGVAAVLVGGVTLSSSIRAALVLLTFYFTSSKLTTYCEDRKLEDESFKKGGHRDWKQVFCNGFVPAMLALGAAGTCGGVDLPLFPPGASLQQFTPLSAAFLGYLSCCCGDTWASELGQLSEDQPRLITSLRPVRKGTNGGVTMLGLLASAAGGLCMGLAFYAAGLFPPGIAFHPALRRAVLQQYIVIPFGLVAGLVGSLVDSVLGATVQFTGYNRVTGKVTSKISEDVTRISGLSILDNNAVNLASASIVAAASAVLTGAAQSAGIVGV